VGSGFIGCDAAASLSLFSPNPLLAARRSTGSSRIGGLEPLTSLEDESLEQVLLEYRISIERLLSVRATTSTRLVGRASRGLSYDLARIALNLGEQDTDRQDGTTA
jgi:hypothetical protein